LFLCKNIKGDGKMYKDTSLGKIFDAETITAGATASSDPINIDGAIELAMIVDITFDSAATGDITGTLHTAMDDSYSVYSEKAPSDYIFTISPTDMKGSYKVIYSPNNFNVQARKRVVLDLKNADTASVTATVYATKASV